jgi:hypothetical protein
MAPRIRLDKGASGSSSGTSNAIQVIATGTRKGVYDGLYDFYQAMRGLAGKGGGVMPASYETGAGGPGGGAGGLPSGSGGGGRPDDGAGAGGHPGAPGTPAGRIGHAVRRQREGSGGVNPGGVPDSGSPAQPPGPPGTYRPQYALGAHDLSPAVLGTIAGEASTRNPAALDAVINNMMNRVGTNGYGPSGNLEEVARSQGVSGRQPQYTGFRTPSAAEAKIISDRIKAIASGGEPDTTHGSMEYRGAGLYQNFKARHPEGVGIGGNWFFPTIKPGPYAASAQPNKMAGALPDRLGHDSPTHSSLWGKNDPINPSFGPAWKAGKFREGIFNHNGYSSPHNVPPSGYDKVRDYLDPKKEQQASLQRRDPGALLKASNQMQAAALKHTVNGEASLKIALSSGLKPVGGVKSSGDLFKQIRLDRASPLPLASTTG